MMDAVTDTDEPRNFVADWVAVLKSDSELVARPLDQFAQHVEETRVSIRSPLALVQVPTEFVPTGVLLAIGADAGVEVGYRVTAGFVEFRLEALELD